jgi:hypothetical protein
MQASRAIPRRPGKTDSALRAKRLQVHIEPVARRPLIGPRGAKESDAMGESGRVTGIPIYWRLCLDSPQS